MVIGLARNGSRTRGDVSRALLAGLALLLLFAAWGWIKDREVRELGRLPPEARQGLYQRSMANLTTICVEPEAKRLESFCQEEAERVLRLPECGAECQQIARAHLIQPTR